MSIFKGSRYTNTPTYVPIGGKGELFTIRERPDISLKDAKYYRWSQSDTLDYLAYTRYGNSEFWWAILDANPQYQSELDIEVGDLLVIPSFNEVVRLV